MKRSITLVAGILVLALVVGSFGCQSYGRAGGLGAGIGAATGAIIGHQSGHAGEGAAIGAVVGGLTGLIAHDVKARRAKSREETMAEYNYEPQQGEKLMLENAQALPSVVQRGNFVEASIQYALLTGGTGAVQVTETRQLRRGDQVVADISSQKFSRPDGTWVSTQQFKIPNNTEPGVYAIMQRVTTAQGSTIAGSDTFTVE